MSEKYILKQKSEQTEFFFLPLLPNALKLKN